MTKFPEGVKDIIESPDVIKLGANIQGDGNKLYRDFGIQAKNLVELGALARQVDSSFAEKHARSVVSLAKVVEHYEHKTLTKGKERMGNWEGKLSETMIDYAANDAHCALMVYKNIMKIAVENSISLSPATYTSSVTRAPVSPTLPSKSSSSTAAAASASSSSTAIVNRPIAPTVTERVSPQFLRAYKMWHLDSKPLPTMCAQLSTRGNPLKEATALELNAALPFSMEKLQELVKMESGSWRRHKAWIDQAAREGRGT
ncbi:hypothetical protein HWV62_25834 [Athelia sp. TMB]|nr:hypothetical protein HWV62_25834 [Athelia sp. TMB]